jgi:hypothetical protein
MHNYIVWDRYLQCVKSCYVCSQWELYIKGDSFLLTGCH